MVSTGNKVVVGATSRANNPQESVFDIRETGDEMTEGGIAASGRIPP
jgi:hypothetical protein